MSKRTKVRQNCAIIAALSSRSEPEETCSISAEQSTRKCSTRCPSEYFETTRLLDEGGNIRIVPRLRWRIRLWNEDAYRQEHVIHYPRRFAFFIGCTRCRSIHEPWKTCIRQRCFCREDFLMVPGLGVFLIWINFRSPFDNSSCQSTPFNLGVVWDAAAQWIKECRRVDLL